MRNPITAGAPWLKSDPTPFTVRFNTEIRATQTMQTNQMAELKQQIQTFLNQVYQMSGTKRRNLNVVMLTRLRLRLSLNCATQTVSTFACLN